MILLLLLRNHRKSIKFTLIKLHHYCVCNIIYDLTSVCFFIQGSNSFPMHWSPQQSRSVYKTLGGDSFASLYRETKPCAIFWSPFPSFSVSTHCRIWPTSLPTLVTHAAILLSLPASFLVTCELDKRPTFCGFWVGFFKWHISNFHILWKTWKCYQREIVIYYIKYI